MKNNEVKVTGFELGRTHITPANSYIQDDGLYAVVLINNATVKYIKLVSEILIDKLTDDEKNLLLQKLSKRWLGKTMDVKCDEPFISRTYISKAQNVSGNVTSVTEHHRLNLKFSNKIREMLIGKRSTIRNTEELWNLLLLTH